MKQNIQESKIYEMIQERYSQDTVLLIATASDNVPSLRSVDTFFYEDSFWIVSGLEANYVQEIKNNPFTMISDGGHNRFRCEAVVTGHPLDEQNLEIREVFLQMFHHWYKEVNNEDLKTVCYIKVTPYKGYFHKDKVGYSFDIKEDTVDVSEIKHHIDVKLVPFW